jgi:hypothetical protein
VTSIELTDEEASALGEVLTKYLKELRYEIADTDNARFRGELKDHYQEIETIARKVGVDPAAS